MPTVPFAQVGVGAQEASGQRSRIGGEFLMMAASDLHEAGMLIEQPSAETLPAPNDKDPA